MHRKLEIVLSVDLLKIIVCKIRKRTKLIFYYVFWGTIVALCFFGGDNCCPSYTDLLPFNMCILESFVIILSLLKSNFALSLVSQMLNPLLSKILALPRHRKPQLINQQFFIIEGRIKNINKNKVRVSDGHFPLQIFLILCS